MAKYGQNFRFGATGHLHRRFLKASVWPRPIRHYASVRVAGLCGEWNHELLSEGFSGGFLTTQGHG